MANRDGGWIGKILALTFFSLWFVAIPFLREGLQQATL
jgi:hypothetical protein